MAFSNSFGWGADVLALFSDSIQINDRSALTVEYNCTAEGDGIKSEIILQSDFDSEKTAEFEEIPAFYSINSYISANFKVKSPIEKGNYYVRLKASTTNPAFTIRKISVITEVES